MEKFKKLNDKKKKLGGGPGGAKRVKRVLFTAVNLLLMLLWINPVYASDPPPSPLPITPTPQWDTDGNVCPSTDPTGDLTLEYLTRCGFCLSSSTESLIPTLPVVYLGTPSPTPTPEIPTGTTYENIHGWDSNGSYYLEPEVLDERFSDNGKIAYSGSQYLVYSDVREEYWTTFVINDYLVANGSTYAVGRKIELFAYQLNRTYIEATLYRDGELVGSWVLNPLDTVVMDNVETTFPGSLSVNWVLMVHVVDARGAQDSDFRLTVSPTLVNSFKEADITKQTTFYQRAYNPADEEDQVAGYCSVYDYKTGDEGGLVEYGGIEITYGDCFVIIPEFSFAQAPVGELEGATWTTPGVSLCPIYINLGEFSIADYDIPTDIVVIPMVAFLIRMIFNM